MKILDVGGQYFGIDLVTREGLDRLLGQHPDRVEFNNALCLAQIRLSPPDFDWEECLAGLPGAVAQTILDESGFGAPEKVQALRNDAVAWARTDEARWNGLIMYVFGGMDLEKLESMPQERWHRYLALAEAVLIELVGIDPTLYLDEEALKKAIQQAKRQNTGISNPGEKFGYSRVGGQPVDAWKPQGGAHFESTNQ